MMKGKQHEIPMLDASYHRQSSSTSYLEARATFGLPRGPFHHNNRTTTPKSHRSTSFQTLQFELEDLLCSKRYHIDEHKAAVARTCTDSVSGAAKGIRLTNRRLPPIRLNVVQLPTHRHMHSPHRRVGDKSAALGLTFIVCDKCRIKRWPLQVLEERVLNFAHHVCQRQLDCGCTTRG